MTSLSSLPVRLALVAAVVVSGAALAEEEPLPEWVSWQAKFQPAATLPRAFVAVGKSGDSGPADFKSEEAEDAARQAMGQIIADWQEAALKCARKDSEAKVKAKSGTGGMTLDWTIETSTSVSFYRDRVTGRAYAGRNILVLLRHELPAMMNGIKADPERSAALKAAVEACGERAFDELSARAH